MCLKVWPSPSNTAQHLYETVLPFLTQRPLSATLADNTEGNLGNFCLMNFHLCLHL